MAFHGMPLSAGRASRRIAVATGTLTTATELDFVALVRLLAESQEFLAAIDVREFADPESRIFRLDGAAALANLTPT